MLSNWSKTRTRRQKIGVLGIAWATVFAVLYFGQYLFIYFGETGYEIWEGIIIASVVCAFIITRVIINPDRHKKIPIEESLAEKRS